MTAAAVIVAFTVGCFGAKPKIVLPTPPEIKSVDLQVEPINYYTIPLSTPSHIIICVQLPSFSHGHDNISGGVACGFTVGELRELYIRQKRT
jgi:hypothetical protein